MGKLTGKIAWITGAASGIGLAATRSLLQAGAAVVMSGRRASLLQDEADQLSAHGNVHVFALDVGEPSEVDRVHADIVDQVGVVNILVNSAGTNVGTRYWDAQTTEGWNTVVKANLDGSFHTMRAVLPGMRELKDGCIINVSSWAGAYHTKLTGAAYNASKSGVIALTETINMEEGVNGIRACAICPAEVATPILDKRPIPPSQEERDRMLQSEDLGEAIRFVAELPQRACVNQMIISPAWNRMYVGGFESSDD